MEVILSPAQTDADLDLEGQVRDSVNKLDFLNGTRAWVNIDVADGHVTLRGNVQSPMSAVEVERAAAEVAGVKSVTGLVVDDATLSRRVAESLARDPRTSAIPPGYEVTVMFGYITLIGRFTEEQALAAQAVSQAVPDVRGVHVKRL